MRSALVVAGCAAAAFLGLLALVVAGWAPLHEVDTETVRRITDVTRRHDGYRRALAALTDALNAEWTVLAVAVVSLLLWWRRRAGTALWLFGVVGIGSLVGPVLKQLVDRPRPEIAEPVHAFSGLSFPSGHSGSATLAAAALLLVAWPRLGPGARVAAVVAAVAFPLLSGWTRLALGGHYPSDLLGGVLLGIAWVAACAPLLPWLRRRWDLGGSEARC
ncbi:phosphatase PAP2 family protein [Nocardioides speluncae]|uniref:phosphatase PAP2 family protein n=1 Tax=Nocardioides speluncae TaxID=2670337 RepID=UPI00137B06EE|nr:phosphatase PAP2 family protein [Nocardioides speluncae]